jgi:RNA polymerase sigma-70 factor, ECF subfamily
MRSVRDHWRRLSRERQAALTAATDQLRESGARCDGSVNLWALLSGLPDHQRSAVLLHHLAGFSIHEVSQVLGRPAGTVKSDLHHARARLRTVLDTSHD